MEVIQKMSNITAKTSSNVFYKARCRASAHNEQLSSREGAADNIFIKIVFHHKKKTLLHRSKKNKDFDNDIVNQWCSRVSQSALLSSS